MELQDRVHLREMTVRWSFTLSRPSELETHNQMQFTLDTYLIMLSVKQGSINDCISHSTNTLGKGMNPIILPPAMGK